MDIRQLEALLAVAEEGSFTAAADRLHTVQSNVSEHVRQLEAELGVQLLVRGRRGAVPTEFGVRVLDRARAIRSELDALRKDLVDAAGPASRARDARRRRHREPVARAAARRRRSHGWRRASRCASPKARPSDSRPRSPIVSSRSRSSPSRSPTRGSSSSTCATKRSSGWCRRTSTSVSTVPSRCRSPRSRRTA